MKQQYPISHIPYPDIQGYQVLGDEFFDDGEHKLAFFNHINSCSECKDYLLGVRKPFSPEVIELERLLRDFDVAMINQERVFELFESIVPRVLAREFEKEEFKFIIKNIYVKLFEYSKRASSDVHTKDMD